MLPTSSLEKQIFEKALLSRFVEEKLLDLFSQGKLFGTVHTCIGQELIGASLSAFLLKKDTVFSNHRCHGHYLSIHEDIEGLFAELMGKSTGVCAGLGGSQHLQKENFYSNGIQGGIVPVATGLALAHKCQSKEAVSVVFIGDGTWGEGVVYESLNIASKWELPLLLVCEDNGVAQSTLQSDTLAGSIEARAAAFDIQYWNANTWDWKNLITICDQAVSQVRKTSKPAILHIKTYRLKAHSKGDDLRSQIEVQGFEKKDPLNIFKEKAPELYAELSKKLQLKIEASLEQALKATEPDYLPVQSFSSHLSWLPIELPQDRKRVVQRLNEAFHKLFKANEKVWMIGEDILSPYGGAFKAAQGLSTAYPDRVRTTPISEAAIVGIGNGLALAGQIPICEIMFGDFLGLAFDQLLNHAAKFQQMYNSQVKVPIIVRTPMGGGRAYGPTHSQTLDKHFLGIPGLNVYALNSLSDPEELYLNLTKSDHPSLVIENKLMYSNYVEREALSEDFSYLRSNEHFPTLWIKPKSRRCDITLLGYGGMLDSLKEVSEILFTEHDVLCQVLCPTQLYPFSVAPLAEILLQAPSLVIVEEGQLHSGFGSEVISQMAESGLLGQIRVKRLGPASHAIPASKKLEERWLPSVTSLIHIAKEVSS